MEIGLKSAKKKIFGQVLLEKWRSLKSTVYKSKMASFEVQLKICIGKKYQK